MRHPAGPDRLRPRTPGATGPRLPIAFRPDPAAVSDHILARIHRRTRMDGVKTAEGGEGATGEMAWAPLGWTGGGRRVLSRRTGPLWPSADVGPGKITGRGRSREPPGTGVAGTLGWPVDGSVADGRRQAGSGIACSRARARLNWFSQGQRLGTAGSGLSHPHSPDAFCRTHLVLVCDFVSTGSCRRPPPASGEMLLRREQPRLAFLPEPEALPTDVSAWLWCSSRSSTAEAMTVSPKSSPHSPSPCSM